MPEPAVALSRQAIVHGVPFTEGTPAIDRYNFYQRRIEALTCLDRKLTLQEGFALRCTQDRLILLTGELCVDLEC